MNLNIGTDQNESKTRASTLKNHVHETDNRTCLN